MVLLDPDNPNRIFAAISSAGAFRSDDGETWRPVNGGLHSKEIPIPTPRWALRTSHRDAPITAQRCSCRNTGCDAQRRRRRIVDRDQRQPADRLRIPIDVHAHEPNTVYVVRITSDWSTSLTAFAIEMVRRQRVEPLMNGLPQRDCYVNVLRDAMAVDSMDSCGVYFGTTGGQVYASADAGDNWKPIVRDLPGVLSVEVQTLR
jgi:hypothetical protein